MAGRDICFVRLNTRLGECWVEARRVVIVERSDERQGAGTLVVLDSGDERLVVEDCRRVLELTRAAIMGNKEDANSTNPEP
jgi:hypothetical protein